MSAGSGSGAASRVGGFVESVNKSIGNRVAEDAVGDVQPYAKRCK
jgi:mevalonate pyrophosphate decarboxylase